VAVVAARQEGRLHSGGALPCAVSGRLAAAADRSRPGFRIHCLPARSVSPQPRRRRAGLYLQPEAAASRTARPANDGQMLVQAVEVDYDYNNSRVSAVGNVQMFYNGTSVEADKVIYDQKTKRLHAEGNIRMTDAEARSPTPTSWI
jgi:hypothetical protein